MQTQPENFKRSAKLALHNSKLKLAIRRTTDAAEAKRAAAVESFPEFEKLRKQGEKIKDHVIQHMGHYLEQFENNAIAQGAIVHWAQTAEQASAIVVDICQQHQAKRITRSKSMLGEEIGLPDALEQAQLERIETDLAEHIIQLAGDPPSHIVWPAMHRTRDEVVQLFRQHHHAPVESEAIEDLVQSARKQLRQQFLNADIGISGANFLLADSGSICTVTNEGNAELTTTPPPVHIVTAGIEKLVPSMAHAMPLLRLLVRSATGSDITQYTTFHNGPKRQGDADGPKEYHIVLVDNGRTNMLAEGLSDMLRCIRCGACMNHCVVYKHIGGHAYGGVYPGPMGSVLTPTLDGLNRSKNLAHACTLNGKCQEVCPVNIALPTLLRSWRASSWQKGYEPITSRTGIGLFVQLATRPALYRLFTAISVIWMRLFVRKGWISWMPFARSWTAERDLLAPGKATFMQQYKLQQKQKKQHSKSGGKHV